MPRRYEAIKKSMKKKGLGEDKAQESASRIFNASRKEGEAPVTGKHKKTRRK